MGNRSTDERPESPTRRDKVYKAAKPSSGLTSAWQNNQPEDEEQYPEMRGIIFHYGLFKIIWDWFVLLLVLYTAIEVPFVVAFLNPTFATKPENSTAYADGENSEKVIFLIDLFVDLFFFCDIIVNFRTTYIGKNDVLVTDTKKIATRYLRTYFIVDFVAAIPWDVVAEYLEKSTTSLSLFKSVRLLRLFQAARRLDQNYEKSVSLLFLMMFAFTLFAHWLACIFYAIGFNESKSEDPNSWLTILAEQSNPFDKVGRVLSLRTRYLTALYFTLTCLTSVGFGNVAANTDYEKLFTIVSMLIGGLLFAAVFGNVSAIIYGHYSGTFKFRERMQSVKYFLGFHKIKGPLARKVKDYARHMWTQTKGISTIKVMKQFPRSLQEEISCYLHFNVIKNCPLFESAEESCLWSLAIRMLRLHYLPKNVIIRQGAIVNSVYFINRGKLEVSRNGLLVGTIGEGDAFGNLYLNGNHRILNSAVTLRSSSCVDVHVLDFKDLNQVLQSFPEFSTELRQKTDTILRKIVLTSQLLNSWDAIEPKESCPEHHGTHIFTTWIRRQKSKRNCNVDDEVGDGHNAGNNITERLVNIPLAVLNSGDTSDDMQHRWRFANIIECRKEKVNGILKEKGSRTAVQSTEHMYGSEQSKDSDEEKEHKHNLKHTCKCTHTKSEDTSDISPSNFKTTKESNADGLDHSRDCEFCETPSEEDKKLPKEVKYEMLESTIQQINSKIETLESKMDQILHILQNKLTVNI